MSRQVQCPDCGMMMNAPGCSHPRCPFRPTPTGRMPSPPPNSQNIPVRTPEGAKIRGAFVDWMDYVRRKDP